MRITTSGKPKKITKKECVAAAKFYGQRLLSSRLYKNIRVKIVFDSPKNMGLSEAYCEWTDDNHNPREFQITINKKLPREEALLVLAHECVHVKQYAKRELKDYLRHNKTSWKGVVINTSDDLDYWDTPWEVEAYGKEKGLLARYLHSIGE